MDVIDFYPEWNAFGTYGKMKVCHGYMDDEWQVKRLFDERHAGVSLDSLPIYDGQTALVRRFVPDASLRNGRAPLPVDGAAAHR